MIDEYGNPGGVDMFNTWHVFGDPSVRVFGVSQPATGLWVTPSSGLEAAGPVGGPFSPGSTVYTLENLNSNGIDYSVTHTEPWVSLDNTGGSLPGLGTATVTVSINSAADGLAHGTYGDTV